MLINREHCVAISIPKTEEIIDNGKVNGVSALDVQKILNLLGEAVEMISKFMRERCWKKLV